jgi:hypothetical protein
MSAIPDYSDLMHSNLEWGLFNENAAYSGRIIRSKAPIRLQHTCPALMLETDIPMWSPSPCLLHPPGQDTRRTNCSIKNRDLFLFYNIFKDIGSHSSLFQSKICSLVLAWLSHQASSHGSNRREPGAARPQPQSASQLHNFQHFSTLPFRTKLPSIMSKNKIKIHDAIFTSPSTSPTLSERRASTANPMARKTNY